MFRKRRGGEEEGPNLASELRPSDFMRARHPELFSDTKIIERAHLDRAVFDHHLDTLTSRKQELAFERFARKLAEKEICPNLIPQTGPTGGGDSKVDTETFPLSQEVADRWYEGQPRDAAQQRWAFAFSTKKDWKSKINADVASVSTTKRKYVRVYFITSRYVKDKARGDSQDQLTKQYGFEVNILDRTWIIERVFKNRREQLAIETLEIDQPLVSKPANGAEDTRREAELDELEQEIADPDRYRGIEYQLVEDCLETALLARGLERPRIEVEGRFERAIRIAETHGTRQQQLRVAYNRAWTLFWWYEDFESFAKAYVEVERFALGSAVAADIELLKNCWQLLFSATNKNALDPATADLRTRSATLKKELRRLQREKERPTNALQAKAQHLFLELIEAFNDESKRKKILGGFRDVLERSKGLINFPARELIDLLMEVGDLFPNELAFDGVFEYALGVAQERDSNATAGRMLLRRGMQKLDHGQPYEAIRLLGRAQQLLTLRECREELVTTLALCARAYEAAGLLWAARGSMLLATSQALNRFWEDGTVTRQAYACVRRLAWLELQLGRVSCVLAYIELAAVLSRTIKLDIKDQENLRNEWMHLDFTLGLLFLKTELFDLRDLTGMASTLDSLRLDFSWVALLYALGHEDRLRSEGVIPEDESSEQVLAVFTEALEKTEANDLLEPEYLDKQKLELQSSLLGCNIVVEVANQNPSLFVGEGLLAVLEAFLATSLDSDLLPYRSNLRIKVIASDFLAKPLEWTVSENDPVIEVRHVRDQDLGEPELWKLVPELIIAITTEVAIPSGAHFKALLRDEQAMGRAMHLAHVGLSLGTVLGHSPKLRLSDWTSSDAEVFQVRRTERWNIRQQPYAKEDRKPPLPGSGEPPPELLDVERLKHRDRKVISLIDIPMWDKARWSGTGFVEHPDARVPPLMTLLFRDRDAGGKIFAAWRREIGARDQANRLRITIITGISRNNPAHYRVVIGANVKWDEERPRSHFVGISRINTMEPSTTTNLDRFLRKYRQDGAFFLAPGHLVSGDPMPHFDPDRALVLSELHVRPAWEIGEHDPDVIGIQQKDDVVIPDGFKEPPVLRALERIRKRRRYGEPGRTEQRSASKQPKAGRNDMCPCGSGKKFKKCHGA